jgi:hypothetical protein
MKRKPSRQYRACTKYSTVNLHTVHHSTAQHGTEQHTPFVSSCQQHTLLWA